MCIEVQHLKDMFSPSNKLTETDDRGFHELKHSSCISRILNRLPATIIVLFLLYLLSSASTFITNSEIHVCVTSKINSSNLYCLSSSRAARRPFLDFPLQDNTTNDSTQNTTSPAFSIDKGTQILLTAINNTIEKSNSSSSSIGKEEEEDSNSEDQSGLHFNQIPITAANTTKVDHHNEVEMGLKDVEEKVELLRSYKKDKVMMINYTSDVCDGKGIYVYDLPPKFNTDLISNCMTTDWMHVCEFLSNNALGDSVPDIGNRWFNTHQFLLEPIFHSRVLNHPCRVNDPEKAKLFYVPYYAGLDLLRWQFNDSISLEKKDELSLELMEWLNNQSWWKLHSGLNHVFVLCKITWDFHTHDDIKYGNHFLNLEKMQNPTKLLIERDAWKMNEVGVPYPSFFHPKSDEDIVSWQQQLMQTPRKHLVSFAGAPRPQDPNNIRSILINQCNSSVSCKFVHCKTNGHCRNPANIVNLFMESEFCLQPVGDSPTRKSFFDSLVSGCIPVVFSPFTAYYQYPWYLPRNGSKFSIFFDQEELRSGKIKVIERLERIPESERAEMKRYIVNNILPGLVYADPNGRLEKFDDASTVAMNALLEKVTMLT